MTKELVTRVSQDFRLMENNPYSFLLSPHLVSAQTKKGRAAQITDQFHPDLRFPKRVVPARDIDAVREAIRQAMDSGQTSVGVTTCFMNSGPNRYGFGIEGKPLTAPWWVGIRNEADIELFLNGGASGKGEYWENGYMYYQRDPSLVETIINTNPREYGLDEKHNFVARVRNMPLGDLEAEMTMGTLQLRALEGQIERNKLIQLSRNHHSFPATIDFGESYANDPIADKVAREFARRTLYEWLSEPISLRDYFEVTNVYGLNTIELIGQHDNGNIQFLKVFEVR